MALGAAKVASNCPFLTWLPVVTAETSRTNPSLPALIVYVRVSSAATRPAIRSERVPAALSTGITRTPMSR